MLNLARVGHQHDALRRASGLSQSDRHARLEAPRAILAADTHKATAEDVAFMKTFGSRIRARVGERREEYLAQPKAAA
jgi:hypothetical protein